MLDTYFNFRQRGENRSYPRDVFRLRHIGQGGVLREGLVRIILREERSGVIDIATAISITKLVNNLELGGGSVYGFGHSGCVGDSIVK